MRYLHSGFDPLSVALIAREHSTSICRKRLHTTSDKGYSAVSGQHFIGYKLHVVLILNGVYHYMELTKAGVHDSQY